MNSLPKIELHLHLEGAAPPAFIRSLARQRNLDLDGMFTENGRYNCHDWPSFLKVSAAASSALQTPEDYARLTLAVAEQSAAQGVIYGEIFLCPDLCGGNDLSAWREHLAAIAETAVQVERDMGLTLRGIATLIRHRGPENARKSARCAAETAGGFLIGIGLAGDETICQPKEFAWGFDAASEAGLRRTADAGVVCGPKSIRDTLAALRPERIGHGIRAIEDLALVDLLAEQGIVLDCCPGSNIALGLYPDWRSHPIGDLYRREVKITVSTGDPPYFGTTMTREFEQLHAAFDWDEGVFRALTQTALDAAFCDADTKTRIKTRLEAAYA